MHRNLDLHVAMKARKMVFSTELPFQTSPTLKCLFVSLAEDSFLWQICMCLHDFWMFQANLRNFPFFSVSYVFGHYQFLREGGLMESCSRRRHRCYCGRILGLLRQHSNSSHHRCYGKLRALNWPTAPPLRQPSVNSTCLPLDWTAVMSTAHSESFTCEVTGSHCPFVIFFVKPVGRHAFVLNFGLERVNERTGNFRSCLMDHWVSSQSTQKNLTSPPQPPHTQRQSLDNSGCSCQSWDRAALSVRLEIHQAAWKVAFQSFPSGKPRNLGRHFRPDRNGPFLKVLDRKTENV